jgi:hypothetical protein
MEGITWTGFPGGEHLTWTAYWDHLQENPGGVPMRKYWGDNLEGELLEGTPRGDLLETTYRGPPAGLGSGSLRITEPLKRPPGSEALGPRFGTP